MTFDVFISYSHQDKPAADAACAALEAAGVRCWIAPRDIEPGAEWAASIMDAIEQCRVMVLILSGNANGSKQVRREVHSAFNRDVPVLPLRVEDVAPAKQLKYYLEPVHWLDALTPPLEHHLERLTRSVTALLRTASRPADIQDIAREHAATPPVAPQGAAASVPDKTVETVVTLLKQLARDGGEGNGKRGLASALAGRISKLTGTTAQPAKRYDLFLSYALLDQPTAYRLCASLEKRRISCWIAPRDIPPNEHYATAIVAAIERSRAMLLLFSASTNDSEQILREVELASVSNIPIYPLSIDKAEPTGGLRYLLANKQMLE
jgi:hypothetical protein